MGGEQSKISHEEDELKLNVDLLLPGEATPGLPSLKDKIVLSERVSKQSFFRAVEEQKTKITEMNENQKNITVFSENIIKLNQIIKKLQPEFEKNSKLFHSAEEVEGLYQNISNFAISNGLNIINLKVQEKKPVMKKIQQSQDQSQEQQNNQQDPNAPQVEYYKIPVAFEIQGNYLGYLKFRRALSKSNKVINFDSEKVTVNEKGGISSKGTLSIVGLPGEYDK